MNPTFIFLPLFLVCLLLSTILPETCVEIIYTSLLSCHFSSTLHYFYLAICWPFFNFVETIVLSAFYFLTAFHRAKFFNSVMILLKAHMYKCYPHKKYNQRLTAFPPSFSSAVSAWPKPEIGSAEIGSSCSKPVCSTRTPLVHTACKVSRHIYVFT